MGNISVNLPRNEDEGEKNEDCVRIGENFTYVIDGTNGITDKQVTEKVTNGRWYVEELDKRLASRISNLERDIEEILATIISELFDEFEQKVEQTDFELQQSETPSAFISIARWNESEIEIYSLGDCSALIKTESEVERFRNSKMVELEEQNLEKLQEFKQEDDLSHEEAMENIMPYYLEVKRRKDIPGGWYSVGFNPKTPAKGETRKYDLESIKELILFTDGFDNLIALKEDVNSLDELYNYIENRRIEKAVKKMRMLEEEDSSCSKAPRYKKSDDVAVARIQDFD
jgi:serine/threonine protein phosphatase PrpC